jgi:hypothetical protein
VHEAAGVGQLVDDEAVAIDGDANYASTQRLEEEAGRYVARIFDGNPVAGYEEHASNDVDCLLGAVGDDDVLDRCVHAARNANVARDGLTQAWITGRVTVGACAECTAAQLADEEAPPCLEWELRDIWQPGAEVELRGSSERG